MKYFQTKTDLEFILTDQAEIILKRHNHVSKYIVGLVLEGTIQVTEKDKVFQCRKDDIFMIPLMVTHSVDILSSKIRFLSMCAGKEFIHSYLDGEGYSILKECLEQLLDREIITKENAIALEDSMQIMIELYHNRGIALNPEMQQISGYIMKESNNEIRLDKLAKSIFVSKYYLIRKFKEEMGLPPHIFQIQNRIRKSQHLLEQNHNIAAVAMEVGFYDQSHFVKTFRSILGITPSEYLESLENLE